MTDAGRSLRAFGRIIQRFVGDSVEADRPSGGHVIMAARCDINRRDLAPVCFCVWGPFTSTLDGYCCRPCKSRQLPEDFGGI